MDRDSRRFYRRMRASELKPYLKSGWDLGVYGHFVRPVATPRPARAVERFRQAEPILYPEEYRELMIQRVAARVYGGEME